jgi:hypothetical protein
MELSEEEYLDVLNNHEQLSYPYEKIMVNDTVTIPEGVKRFPAIPTTFTNKVSITRDLESLEHVIFQEVYIKGNRHIKLLDNGERFQWDLHIEDSYLAKIDAQLKNFSSFKNCPKLLDITSNSKFEDVIIHKCPIKIFESQVESTATFSSCLELTGFGILFDVQSTLTLTNCPKLKELNNHINHLDISKCPEITFGRLFHCAESIKIEKYDNSLMVKCLKNFEKFGLYPMKELLAIIPKNLLVKYLDISKITAPALKNYPKIIEIKSLQDSLNLHTQKLQENLKALELDATPKEQTN